MTFNKPSMNGLNNFSIQEVNEDIANLETTKQNVLTAGTNITINGDEISATGGGTTYTAGSNISISESNVISATDTNTEYTAGTNVSISAGNVISATDTNTDTTYTAGTNVSISAGNVISATDTNTEYTAGTNVSISAGNVISSTDTNTDTTYTAGTNVSISAGNVISSTDTNTEYTAGANVSISAGNVISATDTNTEYTASSNGGLSLSGTAFSLNLSNLTSSQTLPQDLTINGSNYIKQGLILDPYDMPVSSFTYGSDDQQSSTTSLENIYIKFAPTSTVANDWAYLKNIGGGNAGHLSLDFHDDANDTRFSIRNIKSSGQTTDVITEVFNVFSTGITAHTSLYRIPQMAIYNFNKTSMSNNQFGNGNRFINPNTTRTTGTSFSSHNNGSITISSNGYYRIRVCANPITDGYNNRLAFGIYLLIGSTDYFQNQNYNFHGYSYTRNNSDGAFSNINFEDYIYISSGTIIQVRTKLDTDNRNFDNTLSNSQMECYCYLQIERIAETNIS